MAQLTYESTNAMQPPNSPVLVWAKLQRKGAFEAMESASAMERIEAESRRMAALVEELLLLARLDEHRSLNVVATDLAAVATDAVADARAVEADRPLSLEAPLPVVVMGDPDRLRQVVDNLLRNVRVHTPACAPAVVRVFAENGSARVLVEDSGPGIDPEALPHVFDRFWRRDHSRTRATGGAGLGLVIVLALTAAHGGSVTADNRPGGGAVFTLTMPLAHPRSQ